MKTNYSKTNYIQHKHKFYLIQRFSYNSKQQETIEKETFQTCKNDTHDKVTPILMSFARSPPAAVQMFLGHSQTIWMLQSTNML